MTNMFKKIALTGLTALVMAGCYNKDKKFKVYNPITKDTTYFSDELTAERAEGVYQEYSYLKWEDSSLKEMRSILKSCNESLNKLDSISKVSKDITSLYEEGIAIADSILESNRGGFDFRE